MVASPPSDDFVLATCRSEGRFVNPADDEATVLWELGLEPLAACPETDGREPLGAVGCVGEGPSELLAPGASRGRLDATVEVREVLPMDGRPEAGASCFVGDFVGD